MRFLMSTKECSKVEIVLVLVPALSYQAYPQGPPLDFHTISQHQQKLKTQVSWYYTENGQTLGTALKVFKKAARKRKIKICLFNLLKWESILTSTHVTSNDCNSMTWTAFKLSVHFSIYGYNFLFCNPLLFRYRTIFGKVKFAVSVRRKFR